MRDLDLFYDSQEEPQKSCLLALRQIVLNYNDGMTATWRYRMPCFCYHDRVFCYLWVEKKTKRPYILVVRSKEVDHPRLELGDRSKMKRVHFDPNEDLPVEIIYEIFDMVIDSYH